MSIIWLPSRKYKKQQTTKPGFNFEYYNPGPMNYSAASFKKEYVLDKPARSVDIKFACDTTGYVFVNGKIACNGNVKADRDFYNGHQSIEHYYWADSHVELHGAKSIFIESYVELSSIRLYDFSSGRGGLLIEGVINYEDGTTENIETDDSWDARFEKAFKDMHVYDASLGEEPYVRAEVKNYKWSVDESNIKLTVDDEVEYKNRFSVRGNSAKQFIVDFPLIYSAFVSIECRCAGVVNVKMDTFEVRNRETGEHFTTDIDTLTFVKDDKVRLFDLHSLGGFILDVENKSDSPCELIVHVYHSHYPFENVRHIVTNNRKYNDILEKSLYAAYNCSQTMFLDSPKHTEPLASCSGDYNIISLVDAYATGEYDLAKHTIKGYMDSLTRNKGQNANDDYALITIIWLWNIYMMTGDKKMLEDCTAGIETVIRKYNNFVGEGGIIDHPRRYCFIDWLNVDGYGLFSAPSNLGQSVVNMFYYRALVCASLIYEELGNGKLAKRHGNKAKKVRKAINSRLYDKERGLYIEGETAGVPEGYQTEVPANNGKIYYRKHANILAVAYGLTTKKQSKDIMKKMFTELNDLPVQPYFLHYMFEAIHASGTDKKYFGRVMDEYFRNVKPSDKGLPEGFYKPEPSYSFDYSHAWACSPYYSFITASSGIRILEPGMKKISLSPIRLGLSKVSYSIGTPYGFIEVNLEKGKEPQIKVPSEIEIVR